MSSVDASSITLYDFFIKEDDNKYSSRRLLIPAFQRNYAWDLKHVKELFNGLKDAESNYYIGNILIKKGSGSNSEDLIIDGQQRLTTLLLLIKALYEGLNKKNKKDADKILFYDIKKKAPRLRLIRENLNNSFTYILGCSFDKSSLDSDANSKKFDKNFRYIKGDLLSEVSNINTLFESIKNVLFVVIKFNDGYDVNQLFEGLNSKGKVLSTIQLTKNALIGGAKENDSERIIEIWEGIEKQFEQNNTIWFDKFLRHTGFYKYGYTSNTNLFLKIRKDLKETNDYLNFSSDLKKDAELYIKLRNGTLLKNDINNNLSLSDWGTIQPLIVNLSLAGLDQVYSVLFSLIKYANSKTSYSSGTNSDILKDLKKIWAFSILVKYLDTKPSLYERKFATLCYNLSKGIKKQNSIFFLKDIIANGNLNKFSKNINGRIKIDGENNKILKSTNNRNYIAQLLLLYLKDGKSFSMENYSVEHIIPKGKKNGLEKWKEIKPIYKNEVVKSSYKLGNLTLLNNGDTLGNESFDVKLKTYLKDGYKKNKTIKNYSESFNSKDPSIAVEKRGQEIAGTIYNLLFKILS